MLTDQKLRIIQVIPSLCKGGAERLTLDLSYRLVQQGHEVLIITFRTQNDHIELSKGLNIEVVPSEVVHSFAGNGVFNTTEFDRKVKQFKPDVIHSHLLEAEFVSRLTVKSNILYITHWHGCHSPTNPRSFSDHFKKDTWWNINSIRQLKKGYKKCNNQFLCISDFIRGYVKNTIGPNDNQLHVILNGTDLSNFKYENVQRNGAEFSLISIGSFHTYKNQVFPC